MTRLIAGAAAACALAAGAAVAGEPPPFVLHAALQRPGGVAVAVVSGHPSREACEAALTAFLARAKGAGWVLTTPDGRTWAVLGARCALVGGRAA